MRCLFLALAFFFLVSELKASNHVRHVEVNGDQLVTVKTSQGIATLIQIPDRPNSVVVGDQDAFKVEYLDKAITIKPLVGYAKTNLYVYTDQKRYNVELVSGPMLSADYVVYLERPKPKDSQADSKLPKQWFRFSNILKNEKLTFRVKRVGKLLGGYSILEFTISSIEKKKFNPEWIWITQNSKVKPIHSLVLSELQLAPGRIQRGVIQIRSNDLNQNQPFRIELRSQKTSYLTVPPLNSWSKI